MLLRSKPPGHRGTAELDENAPIANKFELMGNYPNPFNPETKIKFSTERDSDVE